jgi:hypothetical protein
MDKYTTQSTINELLTVLDEKKFHKVINVTDIDRYVKKLTAHKFLQLLIIAQLDEAKSLSDLSGKLKDKKAIQNFAGIESISTSQLSRKQCELPSELFEKIFRHLVLEIQAKMKMKSMVRDIGKLLVIDSTTMSMSISQYPWATFRKTKSGVRLHLRVVVTKDLTSPDKGVLLPAEHADRTQMDELIDIDSDAIHLFDRGYNDYKQFEKLCLTGTRFITRIKKNAKVEVVSEQTPDVDNNIFRDQMVYLGSEQNGTKMTKPLRLIQTKDSEDNLIKIITNCFDLSAKEIGDLYRYRWKIETFFKWMKQHLKIKSFYGKSENAVFTQIWIALITYCLQVLMQLKFNHNGPLLELKRSLQNLLFDPLGVFLRSLFRKPTRESKGRRKYNWEEEFEFIVSQFEESEVDNLDELVYDPIFNNFK